MILPIKFTYFKFDLWYLQGLVCAPGVRQAAQLLCCITVVFSNLCAVYSLEPHPRCLYYVYKYLL